MNHNYLKKGTSLELLTAAYFQAHGYLVRRGVVLSVAAGTADATDIDLLAVRFNVPLAEERLIADCKDRKKSRPFERILWTRGLATFANAQQAIVVMPRAPWQAREFAAQGGIEVLNIEEIEKFLHSEEKTYHPFGEAEPELAYQLELSKKKVQYQDKELFKEDLRLRQMLVAGQPLTNLNRIIKLLADSSKLLRQATSPDALRLRRYMYFNAAVIASVMLVRFASGSKWTPEKDWSEHAKKRLTYGDVPPQKAKQLAAMALDTAFFNGLPAPEYTEELIGLIRTYITQPGAASLTPYVIDFQLFGRILRGLPRDLGNPHLIGQEDAIKLARRTLSVLSYAAGVPSSIWSADDPWESRKLDKPMSTSQTDLVTHEKEESKDQQAGNVLVSPTDSKPNNSNEDASEVSSSVDTKLIREAETANLKVDDQNKVVGNVEATVRPDNKAV